MHRIKNLFSKFKITKNWRILGISSIIFVAILSTLIFLVIHYSSGLNNQKSKNTELAKKFAQSQKDYLALKNQDQYKINQNLKGEIDNINKTYKKAENEYQSIVDLDAQSGKTDDMKKNFAMSLDFLAKRNYASADATLVALSTDIKKEQDKIAATLLSAGGAVVSTASVTQSNTPPGSGFSRQAVAALGSTYVVDIVAADMGSTRVIVDTASGGDCGNNCPVLSVGDYAARNGAFAGVNGSYFCPADYPSCAGKTNSFDTLAMNKNKVYFNSGNNVYSTVPAVIFLGGSMRFVGQSLQWGRDTSPDGVLANQGLLVSGGQDVYGDDGDPKKGSKGSRSFVANKGSMAFIGTVHNVTVAEMAHVLQAMGMDGALNLDSGGSVALWANGGYQDGPGRGVPNAILFVRK